MTYNDPTVGHVRQVCLPYSPSVLPWEMSSGELEGEQSPWYGPTDVVCSQSRMDVRCTKMYFPSTTYVEIFHREFV